MPKGFNDPILNATVYYYSATNPEVKGNSWYYDENGNPVAW